MKTFSVSIKLGVEQVAVLESTAAFFKMDVQRLLLDALWSGIVQAAEDAFFAESEEFVIVPSGAINEDIPF